MVIREQVLHKHAPDIEPYLGPGIMGVGIVVMVSAGMKMVVAARDEQRRGLQPRGKQSPEYFSRGCNYTRTTGIWQTVWLEQVPETHIRSLQYYPNVAQNCLTVKASVCGEGILEARASYEGRSCGQGQVQVRGAVAALAIPLTESHLWEAGHGRLYDLELTFGEDHVKSYFGMREIRIQGEKVLLNGEPVFQRLVLDQGYYPEGIPMLCKYGAI